MGTGNLENTKFIYNSLNMNVEAAVGLGDMSGDNVSRHFMIGGNSVSYKLQSLLFFKFNQ